jgi:hypothetical protein
MSKFWLRAASGGDAFADRELAAHDRRDLVALLSTATKELLMRSVEQGGAERRGLNLGAADRVCAVLEAVFLYGWKEANNKGIGYFKVIAEVWFPVERRFRPPDCLTFL